MLLPKKRMWRSNVSVELHLLPTDVLRDILSRLSLKQVVSMSVLSREWRRLGICHPDLVFTKDTLTGSNTASWNGNIESVAAEFITRVDNVLRPMLSTSTTTTSTVNKFVVKFGLSGHHTYHIDRWIDFSTASKAKHIGLDLHRGIDCDDEDYIVPLCKLSGPNDSCVKSLDMTSVCLMLPPSFHGILNLKKLSLCMVSIDASDLQSLLLSCPLLESLSLDCCPLSSFSISQELCRLKYLRVRKCAPGMIQLQAPNLTTFELFDRLTQIVLSESFKLSQVTIAVKSSPYNWCCDATDYFLTELPTALPYVHKLFLHMVIEHKVQKFSKAEATFLNLRYLNLNVSIFENHEDTSWVMGVINLLELAPLLEDLELHIDCDRFGLPDRTVTTIAGPLHRHLRSVHITGFCDFVGIAELGLYILENATVLERIVVVLDPMDRLG